MMDGAGFLGPIPSNWRRVTRYSPDAKEDLFTSVGDAMGIVRTNDCRLEALLLPPGWRLASHICEQECLFFSNDETGKNGV